MSELWQVSSIKLADYENHAIHDGKDVIAHILKSEYIQLIAHAPQMLEMLQNLVRLCDNVELRGQTVSAAKQLIQQATKI